MDGASYHFNLQINIIDNYVNWFIYNYVIYSVTIKNIISIDFDVLS